MEVYLSSLGFDVWMSVVNGLSSLVSPPSGPNLVRKYECNSKEMKAIFNGLSSDVSSQVDKYKLTKSLWDRLKKLYGNEPTTTELVYGNKKRNVTHEHTDDGSRSVSCRGNDEEEIISLWPTRLIVRCTHQKGIT